MRHSLKPRTIALSLITLISFILFFRYYREVYASLILPLHPLKLPADFNVYIRAVDRIHAGLNPYVATDESPYKYSPGALLPFLLLPHHRTLAWMIFKFLSLFSWALALYLGAPLSTWKDLGLLCLGLILSWKGLLETLDYGQLEFWILALPILSYQLFKNQKGLSGFLLGCLPWMKLQWALLLLPFFILCIQENRKALKPFLLGYILGGLSLGLILPILVYGLPHTLELFQSWLNILKVQPESLFLGDLNQSLLGTLSRWKIEWPSLTVIAGLTLTVWLTWIARALIRLNSWHYHKNGISFLTPWLILTQLISPLGWRWGSLLVIGAPFLWKNNARTRSSSLFWILGLGIFFSFLIQQNPIAIQLGFSHWTEPHHYGSITLFWILTLSCCLISHPEEPRLKLTCKHTRSLK